jgi:hypothetical protein
MKIERDNNYDVNIWNQGWHNLDRGVEPTKENSQWKFSFNEIIELGSGYGTGRERTELDIYLTAEEAEAMTLGIDIDQGGDYTPDEDFWLDTHSIDLIYKNVPDRILDYLNSLPEYDREIDNDDLTVLN